MRNYTIRKYNAADRDSWDAFIGGARNATFLFTRGFMDYHSDRFNDFSVLAFDGHSIVAALPANRLGDALHAHQGLTYGGLVLANNLRFEAIATLFRQLLEFLRSQGIATLHLKQLPDLYCDGLAQDMEYLLFKCEADLVRRDTLSVIDLKRPFAYSENKRRNISKATALGMEVRQTDDLSTFWNGILIPNLQQRHAVAPVHSLDEIKLLRERFPKNIKQFNVVRDDRIVGGVTIFETETVAHCQYISGNETENRNGSLDFLFDHLIRNVYHDKAYFDFGISNENQGQQVNQGLLHWKESFGAKIHVQNFYTLAVANACLLDDLML